MARAAGKPQRTQITRDPLVCGGEPTVEGTRVPVSSIVVQWRVYHDMDSLRDAFPHVDASAIAAALKYYENHRAEIDKLIEESEQAAYATD
jgi:uncharacterized protein (DUF433 family)